MINSPSQLRIISAAAAATAAATATATVTAFNSFGFIKRGFSFEFIQIIGLHFSQNIDFDFELELDSSCFNGNFNFLS